MLQAKQNVGSRLYMYCTCVYVCHVPCVFLIVILTFVGLSVNLLKCFIFSRFRVRVTMAGSYDVENESLDVSISASKESISKSVSREAPELMSDPLLPPKGEKPEGIICDPSSGQLTGM